MLTISLLNPIDIFCLLTRISDRGGSARRFAVNSKGLDRFVMRTANEHLALSCTHVYNVSYTCTLHTVMKCISSGA